MTRIDLADLPDVQREQIEREYRAAKTMSELNAAAKAKSAARAEMQRLYKGF